MDRWRREKNYSVDSVSTNPNNVRKEVAHEMV
jgi:hypothetical protein